MTYGDLINYRLTPGKIVKYMTEYKLEQIFGSDIWWSSAVVKGVPCHAKFDHKPGKWQVNRALCDFYNALQVK